jgi:hypothetical protein
LESESESQVFWAPAPLNATSWADVDDDDDYYATTAPPQNVWTASDSHQSEDKPENFEVYLYYLDTFLLLCYNPFLCAYVMIMSCFCLDSIALCLWNQDILSMLLVFGYSVLLYSMLLVLSMSIEFEI